MGSVAAASGHMMYASCFVPVITVGLLTEVLSAIAMRISH